MAFVRKANRAQPLREEMSHFFIVPYFLRLLIDVDDRDRLMGAAVEKCERDC